MKPGVLVETDVLASFLLPAPAENEPSLLHLLLRETICYTSFLQAAELFSCTTTPDDIARIEPALFAVRVLGANARYAPTIGNILQEEAGDGKRYELREAIVAGIAREARLPIITESFSKKYAGIPNIAIIEPPIVRHHLNCGTLSEFLVSVRMA